MKYILAQECKQLLAQYAWSRVLIAFDYDGTLAPIVARPDGARMRSGTRERLRAVCERYPCAVISGRSRADLDARLAGLRVAATVGNHGLEPAADMQEYARMVRAWLLLLRERLHAHAGVQIEDKAYSVALHYRKSRAKRAALAAIDAAVRELGSEVRVVGGKQVVNLVPEGAPHKGIALERLRKGLEADTAIYVGDDITDEDVFALDEPGRLLSIRIGRSTSTHAPYYLRTQSEIDLLLDRLLELRGGASAHRLEEP